MVKEREEEKACGLERSDLFSALMDGVSDEEGAAVLTTEELSEALTSARHFGT
jgi:hypothetical protein